MIPVATPSIWVWTAVDAAVIHISELFTTTLGALAVGTDLSVTTVEDTVFVSADKTGFAITDINIIIKNYNTSAGITVRAALFYAEA